MLSFGQVLTYELEFDIDSNGEVEKLMFYDEYNAEHEENQFSILVIATKNDTLEVKSIDPWVVKSNLYQIADHNLDGRLGIIMENENIYLWLTGYQFACCPNQTTILEWTGDSLRKVFNEEIEVDRIEIINKRKYLLGNSSFTEIYGNREDVSMHFSSFYPQEYFQLSNEMQVDSILTKEKNLTYDSIEDSLNIYSASVVHIGSSSFLISNDLVESLMQREYGIISLRKLSTSDLTKYSKRELRIIRNEIFAYKGYRFKSEDLNNYFQSKNWYQPSEKTSIEIFNSLSEIEKHNIRLIKELEKTVGNKPS